MYDISDPFNAKQLWEKKIGEQVNMVSQSWDGKRLYYTSSLLGNWDKTGPAGPDLHYLKLYTYDGEKMEQAMAIDFIAAKLGAPHQMRFGASSLYGDMLSKR